MTCENCEYAVALQEAAKDAVFHWQAGIHLAQFASAMHKLKRLSESEATPVGVDRFQAGMEAAAKACDHQSKLYEKEGYLSRRNGATECADRIRVAAKDFAQMDNRVQGEGLTLPGLLERAERMRQHILTKVVSTLCDAKTGKWHGEWGCALCGGVGKGPSNGQRELSTIVHEADCMVAPLNAVEGVALNCRHGKPLNVHCDECGVCSDCPPEGYGNDTRCLPCPRRNVHAQDGCQK